MTNAEKFKEIFGIPMDSNLEISGEICRIINCSNILACGLCPIEKNRLDACDFWERKYEERK